MATKEEMALLIKEHNQAMQRMAAEIMRIVWPVVLKKSVYTGEVTFNAGVEGKDDERVVIEIRPRLDRVIKPLIK